MLLGFASRVRAPLILGALRYRRPVGRVLSSSKGGTAIYLGPALPPASSDLPGAVEAGRSMSPVGLAPGGVYQAAEVSPGAGALLPHRFTLTECLVACESTHSAVCFLLHFPSGHPAWELPSTLPFGARTFLNLTTLIGKLRPSGHLHDHFTLSSATGYGQSTSLWGHCRCEALGPAQHRRARLG